MKSGRKFKRPLFIVGFGFVCLAAFLAVGVNLRSGEINQKKEETCSHQKNDKNLSPFNKWKCDHCGEIVEIKTEKGDPRPYFKEIRPKFIKLVEKHLQTCQETKNFINFLETKKTKGQVYDDEKTLKEKEWEDLSIEQIKHWGLINQVILPDLGVKKRVGVAKVLSLIEAKGKTLPADVSDELTFLVPSLQSITIQNFPNLISKKSKKTEFFYTDCSSEKLNAYEKVVAVFLVWRLLKEQKSWNHNIYNLQVRKNGPTKKFFPTSGESGTVSSYLSLLSAYYQKPISRSVAATAFLEIGDYSRLNYCPWCLQTEIVKNPSQQFSRVKISPVGGLEHKIPAAVKAGIKKLILSSEQKANYEQVVPQEIRKQLKVYYVKSVEELEELFWKGEFSD